MYQRIMLSKYDDKHLVKEGILASWHIELSIQLCAVNTR
jgi:hypothetical protein